MAWPRKPSLRGSTPENTIEAPYLSEMSHAESPIPGTVGVPIVA
jgi:hypothetical protein